MATKKNTSKSKSTKNNNNNGKPPRVGALWKSKSGKALQGVIELDGKDGKKVRIFIIPNGFKETENQPDYIVFLSTNDTSGKKGSKKDEDEDMPF